MENKNVHLSHLVFTQAKKYGDRPAMYFRDDNTKTWLPITWNESARQVRLIGKALISMDVKEGDRVGIFSQNMYEIIIADFANFSAKAASVPLYATSTAPQIEYIVNDAEIEYLFVGEQYQYDVAMEVQKTSKFIKKLIVIDPKVDLKGNKNAIRYSDLLLVGENANNDAEIDRRLAKTSEDDLMNILYTSGTTGTPKGVMLHQSNFTEAIRIHKERLYMTTDNDTSMAFLPITHVFERTWDYFCLGHGVKVYINRSPAEIQSTILEVRPTLMCAVPRYWEKVYAAINAKIESTPKLMQIFFKWAISIGRKRNLNYKRYGKRTPPDLGTRYKFFAKPLFKMVHKAAGLENCKYFPCAGARLSDEINEFMHAIGINICYGYGLTESTATVSCFFPENRDYVIGSVGRIMPNLQVKISEEGEILLKGKTITAGYYKRPDANKEAFTSDGWFKTGDAGYIDMDNNLYITDRIKDLFKTAGGKYIAPQLLEGIICDDKFVEQAAAIGNERKYVTMLIVPAFDILEPYAKEKGIKYESRADLIQNPEIVALYEDVIKNRTKELAKYEQIKKFTLLVKPFTMEQGHLTNTLKLKRKVINELFSKEIAAMYTED